MFSTHGTWGWEDHDWIFMSGWAYPLTKDWSRPDLQDQNNLLGLRTKWLESHACCLEVTSDLQYLRMDGVFRGHTAVLRSAHAANTSRPACMRCVVLCHCKVVDALLTSEVCVCVCVCVGSTRCAHPSPPPCVRVRVRVWQRNICAYAVVIVVKMAEGETEKEYDTRKAIEELRERFQGLTTALKESSQSPLEASLHFCQEFCQVSPSSCCSSRAACSPSGFLAEDARLRLLQQCS